MSNKLLIVNPLGGMMSIDHEGNMNGATNLINLVNAYFNDYMPSDGDMYAYVKQRFSEDFPDYYVYVDMSESLNVDKSLFY